MGFVVVLTMTIKASALIALRLKDGRTHPINYNQDWNEPSAAAAAW